MIKLLSDKAICMCPHGGQLQFMPSHMKADGMDGSALTIQDYQNAIIVGCTMPPPPAGVSPCLKVLMAQDPLGQAMKIDGIQVVTQMVISITDKGWPIMVINPGMSAMSLNIDPGMPSMRKAEFTQGSVQKQTGLGIGEGANAKLNLKPFKDVTAAYWGSDYARRDEKLILKGNTIGFGDGTPATLLVYEYDHDGKHDFVTSLSSTVKQNQVEAKWSFVYQDDVDDLPNKVEGDETYFAPEYFFELKVGGKSARSGLLEFRDWIEIEVSNDDREFLPFTDFTAYFADGSSRIGALDADGKAKLLDIPPGKVHWTFNLTDKEIRTAEWSAEIIRRDEVVQLKAKIRGFKDDTGAILKIFQHDPNGNHELITELTSKVKNNKVEEEWIFKYDKNLEDLGSIASGDEFYRKPAFFFELEIEAIKKKSELLGFKDWLEIKLVDDNDKPIAGELYRITFADGQPIEGRLDENGVARLEDIYPGSCQVTFPNLEKGVWEKMT